MNEERLDRIETKITFLEDLIDELNKVVYQQQKKLDRLETICELLVRGISNHWLKKGAGVCLPTKGRPIIRVQGQTTTFFQYTILMMNTGCNRMQCGD